MKTIVLILLAFFCCTIHVKAQPFYFRHYEVEDGLSNNTVITALQDKYGFMWLGTSEGLNRFDGTSFKVYRYSVNDKHSLKSNSIYCLYEDVTGHLWVGTEKGIFLYDAYHDYFTQPVPVADGTVRSICDDTDGLLWFILNNELYYYDASSKKLYKKYVPGITQVSVLKKNSKGGVWVGTTDGKIARIKGKNAVIYQVSAIAQNSVEAILCYQQDRLMVGTSREGLLSFNLSSKTVQRLMHENKTGKTVFVRNMLQVSDSSIFVCTEEGLYIYNPLKEKYWNLLKETMNPFSLSDNALYALCKDREGGIWIGSYFGGVNYLPHTVLNFEKFFPTSDARSIGGSAVREITKDVYGNLWIGSEDGGLSMYDPVKNEFTRHVPNQENQLSSMNIHGLLAVKNNLLIGTFEHGLDVMDISSARVTRHFNAGNGPYDLKSDFINKIIQTHRGTILICTSHGVFRFDLEKGRFDLLKSLPAEAFYSAITQDTNGTIWIGTHNKGLFYINDTDTASFKLDSGTKNKLEQTRILYLLSDAKDHLWVCTIDGLFNIDLKSRTCKYYDQESGLPSNIIYSIIKDDQANYWIPTSHGLAFMEGVTQQIKTFRQNDGLLNNQFNYQSAFKDDDGYIYLGSIKGLIKFNPSLFHSNMYVPPLYITGIQQLGLTTSSPVSKNETPLLNKDRLTLAYNQSTFNIDFTALHFTDPTNIEYAYRINNGGWYQVGNSRRITFTNLSPGKYTVSVRSTNDNGEWMPNNKTLLIEILPPFWKSGLAYVLYTILFITFIIVLFNYYTRRQKEKQLYKMSVFTLKKEKELHQAKMDFFTNITHEIKTPLTLIKLPLERITSALNNAPHLHQYLQIMNSNTQRLLELTHQLLDFRKIETEHYHLFLTNLDIVEVTEKIIQSFSQAITEKNIAFHFTPPTDKIIIAADKEALIKIISNLTDNAVKYCQHHVEIHFEQDPVLKLVTLHIMNDGKTVPENMRADIFEPFVRQYHHGVGGSGIGLSLVNSLIQLHKGSIKYSVVKNMNIFSVAFPLKVSGIDINQPTNNEP